jgi:magnesium transporter
MLSELDEDVRDDVLDQLDSKDIAAVAREMEADDAANLIEDLPEDEQAEVLAELPAQDRADIESALAYPEDSAGRMMQRSLVKVPDSWTVGEVIDYCREATDLPDDVYDLFVVDRLGRLRGSVPILPIRTFPRCRRPPTRPRWRICSATRISCPARWSTTTGACWA